MRRMQREGTILSGMQNDKCETDEAPIYFFDPNGIRIELTVRAIEEEEMKRLGGDDLSIPLADRQRGCGH